MLHSIFDLIMHLDRHLLQVLVQYGPWIYGLLFLVIFAETGLVVTPFLPGDSLLFAAGALAASDPAHGLQLWLLLVLLIAAAIAGNSVNYFIGRLLGRKAMQGHYRFIRPEYLQRTEQYFVRHGAMAVVLSRFMPIVRTFAPFVAGIGRMPVLRFQFFNAVGAVGWVGGFLCGGYLFGNLPWVKGHFGLVTLAVIVVSLLPLALSIWRDRGTSHG